MTGLAFNSFEKAAIARDDAAVTAPAPNGARSADSSPLVSVVIPTYNYARYLPAAIDSVLRQTYQNVEIIVVDGGSTDNTADVLQAYGGRIKYLLRPSKYPNDSRNAGIENSLGKYIAFLDADDYWLPDKLMLQVQLLEADATLGLVYGGIHLVDGDSGAVVGYHPLHRCARGYVLRELYEWMFIPSPTPVVPRAVFASVGSFRRILGPDDWEMWLRIASKYKIDYVNDVVAAYRVHPSLAGQKSLELYEQEMVEFFEESAHLYPSLQPRRRARLAGFVGSIGWRLVRARRLPEGRHRLMRALRMAPWRAELWLKLAVSWLIQPEPKDAQAIADTFYRQAKYELYHFQMQKARALFWQCISTSPLTDIRFYLGFVLTFLGRTLAQRLFRVEQRTAYCGSRRPPAMGNVGNQW